MARRWSCYRDLLPVVVIIGNEFNDVGLLTLFKAATLQGMNNHVFVAYAYAVATIVLLPVTLFSRRSRVVIPPLNFSIISKIVLLGVTGSSSQILGYAGINYSSPTLASSIGNLVPAFTFMLAVAFRMEKLAAKSKSSQAKVIGSIISIAGAFVLTFYKGPSIINAHTHLSLPPQLQQPIGFLKSEDANWAIAGILLTADYFLASLWYILMGIFGKLMSNIVYAWSLHLKGPVFVTLFKPLQIVISVAMGVMFLGDTLHVGSIIGATIISIGLYAVLWGKVKEEIDEDVGSLESQTTENAPLLQSYRTETFDKKTAGNV